MYYERMQLTFMGDDYCIRFQVESNINCTTQIHNTYVYFNKIGLNTVILTGILQKYLKFTIACQNCHNQRTALKLVTKNTKDFPDIPGANS